MRNDFLSHKRKQRNEQRRYGYPVSLEEDFFGEGFKGQVSRETLSADMICEGAVPGLIELSTRTYADIDDAENRVEHYRTALNCAPLTSAERQILQLTIEGKKTREISVELGMSVGSVCGARYRAQNKVTQIYRRMYE